MKNYILLFIILLSCWFTGRLTAQEAGKTFSLKEAQDYALKHHATARNAGIDLELAKKKIWETTAIGLPQVNAAISYQYMLDVPTTLLPDFITPAIIGVNKQLFGLELIEPEPPIQYFPAKFGTEQNLSLQGTLSQLIFNGQYLVGLQAARTFYRSAEKNLEKAGIEVRANLTQTYYMLAVFKENRKLLSKTVTSVERTLFELEESYKNGLVEDIVVDQMKYNLANLRNTLTAVDGQLVVADKLLKFQMGLDLTENITITDSVPVLLESINQLPMEAGTFKAENHIDYRIVETGEQLQYLNLKKEQANYLPVLSAFFTRQENAMRDQFDFLDKSGEWYPTTILGINLSVPIFTSGMQHARVQQARLELEKMRNTKSQVKQGLSLAAEEARITYNNALDKFLAEKDNLGLSDKIYQKTLIKFREGIASSTELTQNYNQYLTSQTTYFNTLFELLNARIMLDKAYQQF